MEATQGEEEQASFDLTDDVSNAANSENLPGNVANSTLNHNRLLRNRGDDG